MDHTSCSVEPIERALRIPRVAVFAGGTTGAGNPTGRLPSRQENAVAAEIAARLEKLDAAFGYAPLTSRHDILFFEAMLAREGEIHVVLPCPADDLLKTSVGIALDTDWRHRCERVIDQAATAVVVNDHLPLQDSAVHEYAGLVADGLARLRARALDTELTGVMIVDDRQVDGPQAFGARMRRWQAQQIDTALVKVAAAPASSLEVGNRTSEPARSGSPAGFNLKLVAILFADAVGFSKLTEEQIPRFVHHFLGSIGELLASVADAPITKNTWGDAIYLVFPGVEAAGRFALDLRDLLHRTSWKEKGLPENMSLRIALHAGPVYSCLDPVLQQLNFIGSHVNRAARIEPITPPGQVYASQLFAALAAAADVGDLVFDYVGQVPLAKHFGTFPLYHVGRSGDGVSAVQSPRWQ